MSEARLPKEEVCTMHPVVRGVMTGCAMLGGNLHFSLNVLHMSICKNTIPFVSSIIYTLKLSHIYTVRLDLYKHKSYFIPAVLIFFLGQYYQSWFIATNMFDEDTKSRIVILQGETLCFDILYVHLSLHVYTISCICLGIYLLIILHQFYTLL